MKCYLSDNLASDSEDEKQLNRARSEAASNKKKRETDKLKDRKIRESFSNTESFSKIRFKDSKTF